MLLRKLYKKLDIWVKDPKRKPLVLRGARQVGKTTLIKGWYKKHFAHLAYINLEDTKERLLFESVLHQESNSFEIDDVVTVIANHYLDQSADGSVLEFEAKTKAGLADTLIFIDEIQALPALIPLLRFFYEKYPNLYVVCAGSFLEVKLRQISKDKKFDFTSPVGRVDELYLYPLDFFEYLNAVGEEQLLSKLIAIGWDHLPTPDIQVKAAEKFEEYFLYGGMPEVVNSLSAVKGLTMESQPRLSMIYNSLINGYQNDTYKYGLKDQSLRYLQYVLANSPNYAGRVISDNGFAESAYKSADIVAAFAILEDVMFLTLARSCSDEQLPWNGQEKRQKKLIFLDVGLVNYSSGVTFSEVRRSDLNQIHRGRVAEQVVGQHLVAEQDYSRPRLNYWTKDYREGAAEVDFCIASEGYPVGIEVKSGNLGRIKSLFEFKKKVPDAKLMRIHSGNMQQETRQGIEVKSLPFYLLPRLRELI